MNKSEVSFLPKFSKLDIAAIASATLLSIGCLARGAVYDSIVAFLLLATLPVLWLAGRNIGQVHHTLKHMGMLLFGTVLLVMTLQYLNPASDALGLVIQDRSAFLEGIGRTLYFIAIFVIALCVGTNESSARIFLHALLLSGAACVCLSFFIATDDGVPTTTFYSFTHGFVNPNNAASYLGIMFLLALAQAVRFFKTPFKNFVRELPQMLDRLNMISILNGSVILFSILLLLACLFMTGSRGGIFVAFLCTTLFFVMIVLKMNLTSRMRKITLALGGLAMLSILVWSFINFGAIIAHKFTTDGVSSNSRMDIMASVLPMIGDHKLLGTGLGSFAGTFQHYRPTNVSSDGIIDKAHNSYLEFAAEMGLPALFVLLLVLGWAGATLVSGVKGRKERYVVPALGLTVWMFIGLHSLADFPLQIPGIAAIFIALITVCVSQTDPRFGRPPQSSDSTPIRRIRSRKRRTNLEVD